MGWFVCMYLRRRADLPRASENNEISGGSMTRCSRFVFAAAALFCVLLALPASAQQGSGISGVARDDSGAVMPGVTVEASSPALIEKVRSAVTDGSGQYRIVNLLPGTYTVTFTLPGFGTFKREGI